MSREQRDIASSLPASIRYTLEGDTHRLTWSNRQVRRYTTVHVVFLLMLLVLMPWILVVTSAPFLVDGLSLIGWAFFLFGLFLIWAGPYFAVVKLLGRYRSEEIVIDKDCLSTAFLGWRPRQQRRVRLLDIRIISLECYYFGDGPETCFTLNVLFHLPRREELGRIILADVAHPQVLASIFQAIRSILEPSHPGIEFKNKYTRDKSAKAPVVE